MADADSGALTMPRWLWFTLCIATVATLSGLYLRPQSPAQLALQAFLAVPAGADGHYPQRRSAHRFRAWMTTTPAQPQGLDVFEELPDAAFLPERALHEHELRSALHGIAGLELDTERGGWKPPAGGLIPLAAMRERLEALSPTPTDARVVLGLFTGQPSPATAATIQRLRRGEYPTTLRIQPFRGLRGRLVLETAAHQDQVVERGYEGCLLRFDGPGWPTEWKLAELWIVGR